MTYVNVNMWRQIAEQNKKKEKEVVVVPVIAEKEMNIIEKTEELMKAIDEAPVIVENPVIVDTGVKTDEMPIVSINYEEAVPSTDGIKEELATIDISEPNVEEAKEETSVKKATSKKSNKKKNTTQNNA